jgi:hypothetical protein
MKVNEITVTQCLLVFLSLNVRWATYFDMLVSLLGLHILDILEIHA